jgi:hypothetical protein
MRNKRLIKNYSIEYAPDKNGRERAVAVYKGEYYVIENPEKELLFIKIYVAVSVILSSGTFIGTSFIDVISSYKIYVVLPQIAAAFSVLAFGSYAFPVFSKRGKLTGYKKACVAEKAPFWAAASAVLSGVTALGRLINFIIDFKFLNYSAETLLLAATVIILVIFTIDAPLIRKISFKKIDILSK